MSAAQATGGPLRVLLLCAHHAGGAGTINDHIAAFTRLSRHSIVALQNMRALNGHAAALPPAFPLEQFDAIVFHYTNYLPWHMDPPTAQRIRDFPGLKIAFVQDEYRTVNATVAALRAVDTSVLFTCVPEGEVDKVYPESTLPGVRKISNLTGYVPDVLTRAKVPSIAQRPIDVGYRSRKVPFWLGELGAEKWRIGPGFVAAAQPYGLRCDISHREEDRLYGKHWTAFIASCRTMLGVESGASVFDFDGSIQRETDRYVREHPAATFEEVQARFFKSAEHRIKLNQISPRCFETAALRCGMVLFEGEYSGILVPWRHYVPLRKDFANIDEVVDAVRDEKRLQALVDCTYEEIALNPALSYRAFAAKFDDVVASEMARRGLGVAAGRGTGVLRVHAALWNLRYPLRRLLVPLWVLIPKPVRLRVKPAINRVLKLLDRVRAAI